MHTITSSDFFHPVAIAAWTSASQCVFPSEFASAQFCHIIIVGTHCWANLWYIQHLQQVQDTTVGENS